MSAKRACERSNSVTQGARYSAALEATLLFHFWRTAALHGVHAASSGTHNSMFSDTLWLLSSLFSDARINYCTQCLHAPAEANSLSLSSAFSLAFTRCQ